MRLFRLLVRQLQGSPQVPGPEAPGRRKGGASPSPSPCACTRSHPLSCHPFPGLDPELSPRTRDSQVLMAGRDPPQAWGPVWALRLTVACVLLGISGGGSRPLSEGPPGPPVGEATMDISLLHQADSEMDMSPEMVLGTLPDHCRPPSSRCQSFLGDLRVRLQSRFHLLLLGNRHPWPLCQELCDTWLASCETDPACTPAWLSITGSRLCPAGCRTYAKRPGQHPPPGLPPCPGLDPRRGRQRERQWQRRRPLRADLGLESW
ncbi:retbindin isoform X2 [Erinaceus europaeus]|uniref:Retbindin isoform X2 n=1 Tax=Erinaceus europaeus TaxID=9365 RepID=A0ABM3WMK7_ERIEU|nr:retbindin isoform X2 [Erinaceus europaeus]